MSGAIHRTDVSVAAIVAHELGLGDGGAGAFRRPVYGGPGDGLPVNIEALVRHLEREPGSREGLWQLAGAAVRARRWLDDVEDYWERGAGARFTPPAEINHNLGVYGWRFDHALERTARRLQDSIRPARDAFVKQVVQDHRARARGAGSSPRGRGPTSPRSAPRGSSAATPATAPTPTTASRPCSSCWGPTTRSRPSCSSG